jgi:hypothetical protein
MWHWWGLGCLGGCLDSSPMSKALWICYEVTIVTLAMAVCGIFVAQWLKII